MHYLRRVSSHSICAGIVNAKLVQQSPSSLFLALALFCIGYMRLLCARALARTRRVSLSLPTFAFARF